MSAGLGVITMGIIELSVAKLRERCDPFAGCCWPGLDRPITVEDVYAAIRDDNLAPPGTDAFGEDATGKMWTVASRSSREGHVSRIAWFVVHGWDEPLGVDVGVPSLGCRPIWLVIDGNHRWAAAICRGDRTISAVVDGSVDEIEKLVAAQDGGAV